jgi:hypothetical protein
MCGLAALRVGIYEISGSNVTVYQLQPGLFAA